MAYEDLDFFLVEVGDDLELMSPRGRVISFNTIKAEKLTNQPYHSFLMLLY